MHPASSSDFLAGNQTHHCTPWGMPTRNHLRLAEALLSARRRRRQDLHRAKERTTGSYGTAATRSARTAWRIAGYSPPPPTPLPIRSPAMKVALRASAPGRWRPEISLDHQRPAQFIFSEQVQQKLSEIRRRSKQGKIKKLRQRRRPAKACRLAAGTVQRGDIHRGERSRTAPPRSRCARPLQPARERRSSPGCRISDHSIAAKEDRSRRGTAPHIDPCRRDGLGLTVAPRLVGRSRWFLHPRGAPAPRRLPLAARAPPPPSRHWRHLPGAGLARSPPSPPTTSPGCSGGIEAAGVPKQMTAQRRSGRGASDAPAGLGILRCRRHGSRPGRRRSWIPLQAP